MKDTSVERDQTEEGDLMICDIADQTLEIAAATERDIIGNITWYQCPTGLTICRF